MAGLTGVANAQDNSLLPLKWEVVEKPSIKNEIVVRSSEINRMAASHDIIYVVDTVNKKLHRSNNGGLTFTDITNALKTSGVTLPIYEIAVAPDRPQYVAVVTNNRTSVYMSDDSGVTWHGTGNISLAPLEEIQCITTSNGYLSSGTPPALLHDIAIGTAIGMTGTGRILTLQMGASFSSWIDQGIVLSDPTGPAVSAVAFSPKYSADPTILATASDLSGTALCIGARDIWAQTTKWNGAAGYTAYPMPIDVTSAVGVMVILSNIALPSDYDGSDPKTRLAFVSYNRTPDIGLKNNAYRIDDDVSAPVQSFYVTGGVPVNINSIAYYGTLVSGKLLAGFADPITGTNISQVKWTLNPLGTPIGTLGSTVWNIAIQPPSGPGNALVAWSYQGTIAFCGTGKDPGTDYDESAFSQSYDNGNTWEQTSLINTIIRMCDIAPVPDSRSLFMATFSTFGPEGIWRSAGEPLGTYWSRIYSIRTSSDMVLLRLSPDYSNDYTIYAVEADSDNQTLMVVSHNRGNTWKKRYVQGPVIDMIAASRDTLYVALPCGYVRKSTDGGLTWGTAVLTALDNINMLALAGNGDLFAGSEDSKVAYSTDNGTSFVKIEVPIGIPTGYMQVVADADYSSNNIIYAADNFTDRGVWRWIIGQSTEWEQIDEEITALNPGQIISGLMTGPEGTLYPLRAERPKPDNRTMLSENHTGGMNRTLNPTADPVINIEWDIVNRTLNDNNTAFDPEPLKFFNNPPWLKLSGNSSENDLWTIDTANLHVADDTAEIYRFRDNLCKIGPWIKGPEEVGSDPVTGRNQQVDLAWEQLSFTDRYELQVAKDRDLTLRINPEINSARDIWSVIGSILMNTDDVNVTSPAVWLPPGSLPEAGAFYYWRIRCIRVATWEFIRSPWSDTARFLVRPGFPVTYTYYGPGMPSQDEGSGQVQSDQPVQTAAERNRPAPLWAWIGIGAGIITAIVLFIIIIKLRNVT